MQVEKQKKLTKLFSQLFPPTKICKICFKPIIIDTFPTLFCKSQIICHECSLRFKPVFNRFYIDGVECINIYKYDDTIRETLYQIKGCYDIELAPVYLSPFKHELHYKYQGYVIVPAPSSEIDDQLREFNHVIEIFKVLDLPIKKIINKTGKYKQSDQNKEGRKEIINHLELSHLNDIGNMKILIVDDVYTTGNTIKAMISMIKKCKPKDIKVLIMARTTYK